MLSKSFVISYDHQAMHSIMHSLPIHYVINHAKGSPTTVTTLMKVIIYYEHDAVAPHFANSNFRK